MQDTLTTPVSPGGLGKVETGLGAWASAISGDDNAQAAIALAEAINRARTSQASREHRAVDARVIAVSRLETLRARLAPVYAAIPRDVELFDLGMVGHSPPRLFVDIIAYVEMREDQKGFRLVQETRTGRVVLGEVTDEKQMTALVTDYIAERLVDRERALAVQGFHQKPQPLPKANPPVPLPPVPLAAAPVSASDVPDMQRAAAQADHADMPPEDLAASAASPVKEVVATASSMGAQVAEAVNEGASEVAAMPAKVVDAVAATATPALASTAPASSRAMASSTGLMPTAVASAVGLAAAAGAASAVAAAPRNGVIPSSAPAATPPAPVEKQSSGWLWALLALLIGIGIGALALYLYAANLSRP